MNGRLQGGKERRASKEETGAMAENSMQPGELDATPEDQHPSHEI